MKILDDILHFFHQGSHDGALDGLPDHLSEIGNDHLSIFMDNDGIQDGIIIDKVSEALHLDHTEAEEFLEISQSIQHSLSEFGDVESLSNIDHYINNFDDSPESFTGLVNNIKGIYGEHEVYEQLKDKFGDDVLLVRDMATNNPDVDFLLYDDHGAILEKIQVKITSDPEYVLEAREHLSDDIHIYTTKEAFNKIIETHGEVPEGIFEMDLSNSDITERVERTIHILKDTDPDFDVLLHDPVLSEYVDQDYSPFGRAMYSDYKYRPTYNWTYSSFFEDTEIPDEFTDSFMDYDLHWDPDHFDGVGNPFEDANHWMQQTQENSCAVAVQRNILESLTGKHYSEEELCSWAESKGLYDPDIGTLPSDMAAILKEEGINVIDHTSAEFNQIESALQNGNKVMVGLDASEIWNPLRDLETGIPVDQPSLMHCAQVTGIDYSDPNLIKVILADPGTNDGALKAVSIYDFMNAWGDSGFRMAEASLEG